jgi:hypothetical protein
MPSQTTVPRYTIYLLGARTFSSLVNTDLKSEDFMGRSRFRASIALAIVSIPLAAAYADPSEPRRSKSGQTKIEGTLPSECPISSDALPSGATWRATISRPAAIYMVQHVDKACRIIVENRGKNALFVQFGPKILNDLRIKVLGPIFRSHPGLQRADIAALSLRNPTADSSGAQSPAVFRATRQDIDRTTALRLDHALSQIERELSKVDFEAVDQTASKETAELASQAFQDMTAELGFAAKPTSDAYPEIWAKKLADTPKQSRTAGSDAGFRKQAPPRGSVKLSDAALAFVKSFMRQIRRDVPPHDQIASIGWARDQKTKSPADTAWIDKGPGWVLGAYAREQLPPDVIDKVRGIEIVFRAEDPSLLTGKTVDLRNQEFFVRD